MRHILAALLASLTWLCTSGSVHAQATRTWVSGVGDDANPCSRPSPCKTFAGAIAKTAASGEIDALDPGEFGPVTITKAIIIDGHRTLGATMTVGSTGVTVNAGAADTVILRGLTLHGDGTQSGVLFSSGAALQVEDCTIAQFKEGVDFEPPLGGQLFLLGVSSRKNADAGVLIRSGGPAASFATLVKGHFEDNGIGLLAGAGARVDVYDSVASGNSVAGVSATLDSAGGTTEINLESVAVNENGIGVTSAAAAGTAVVRMSQVLGTGNATGPLGATGSGSILSFGDNRLDVQASLTLSSSAPSQQVMSGGSANFPLAVAVTGILADPISFTCDGLPAGVACGFAPETLPGGVSGGMVTITVSTSPSSTSMMGRHDGRPAALALLILIACGLAFAARRWRFQRPLRAAAGIILAMALGYSGCSDSQAPPDMSTGLAAGTYPFHVTATSGATTATLPLTLIVN